MTDCPKPILTEDDTCWRLARADRAAVLVDAAPYFGALRAALLKAERSVFIAGWDIDSRTRLVGPDGDVDDGLPERLGPFLTELVSQKPDLKIHILLWDYSMLYALEREPMPAINLDWKTPKQISVCLDDVLPVGSCHHQKIVVIDDAVAFSGGIDLTIRRWDTPAHEVSDEHRCDPTGQHYRPFHDIQMMVDGKAAQALGELVRHRWRFAACETPMAVEPTGDPWPDAVDPDFTDVEVGIARTVPEFENREEIREVEALFIRAVEAAQRTIYIENQFLTAEAVSAALARRLKENDRLEVLIVAPNLHYSWLEEHSMNTGRRRFMDRLASEGVADRVRLLFPAVPDDPAGEGVMVHAKFMVVDDRLLRVGSANLNNRSMGMDTECDLAIEAREEDTATRQGVAGVRNRLLAEHLGTDPDRVAEAVEEHGSLFAAVAALSDGERTLAPVDLKSVADDAIARTVGQVADPERPIDSPNFVGDLFGGTVQSRKRGRIVRLAALAVALLGLAALWRYTPLSEFTDIDALKTWMDSMQNNGWLPVVIPAIFVFGGLLMFPVTVLIAVTGMMFSPLVAFAYAIGSSLLSACVTFLLGRAIGRNTLRPLFGQRVNRVSRSIAERGVVSVTILRMVPIAPFTVINLVAGASHIRISDFLMGSVLGMAPGILVMSFLGHQLGRTLTDPTPMRLLYLGLGLAGWLLLCIGLQYAASKLRPENDDGSE